MKNIKKTKIVATLGPASSDRDTIKQMMVAGVNVFRINFSHADFDAAKERIQLIRDLNKELGYNVGILAESKVVHPGGIIGLPTGCPYNGANVEIQGFGFHVQIDGIVFAGVFASLGIVGADNLR